MQNFLKFSVTLREALDELVQSLQSSLVVVRGHRFGAGAGIIWDSSGLILTNQHVVGEDPPVVLLPDNREVEARLVAQDAQVDLALLAVQAPDLTAVRPAPSLPRVGEMVFAFGHPWGQRGYVTSGIVSAVGAPRTAGSQHSLMVIRTDAPLAPGNSGGPLVNGAGEVVGINAMIVGGDQSIAIPVSVAHTFVQNALAHPGSARPPDRPDLQGVL